MAAINWLPDDPAANIQKIKTEDWSSPGFTDDPGEPADRCLKNHFSTNMTIKIDDRPTPSADAYRYAFSYS